MCVRVPTKHQDVTFQKLSFRQMIFLFNIKAAYSYFRTCILMFSLLFPQV